MDKVKIIPLGGLEQIGLNMTAIEYDNNIVVIDCGLGFPDNDMLGIDLVIPDVTYLKDNLSKVRGLFITHGHEDHIGAIPYVMKELPGVPVYGTTLTCGIIELKLKEFGLESVVELRQVTFGDTLVAGPLKVEYIRTNHSIVDAAALAIYTPQGIIIHTGDFKVDYTPVYGDAIDLQRFAELGHHGVLLLMSDSTNAERPGFTPSEKTLKHTFESLFLEHEEKRLIIATFASNVDRVQQIINTAQRFKRKVAVEGRSMNNIINTAIRLGRINIPEGLLVDIDTLNNLPPKDVCIITTGSQGESMAALSRMAMGIHKKIDIGPTDTVIFSSHPIPGNEKAVIKIVNELHKRRATVVIEDAHVSGHACQEEIKLIYALTSPKFAVPVHGEYKHRLANAGLARDLGIPSENIFMLNSGDVLEVTKDSCQVNGKVEAGYAYVDGLEITNAQNASLRDRQRLSEEGIVVISAVVDLEGRDLYSVPQVMDRGISITQEIDAKWAQEVGEKFTQSYYDCMERGINQKTKLITELRNSVSSYIWSTMKKRPLVLIILEEL